MYDGVGCHDPERRRRDVLAGERACQHRRRVERPTRQRVDHQKPQGDGQPREQPADHAARDALVDGSFHRALPWPCSLNITPGRADATAASTGLSRSLPDFPSWCPMTGDATTPELPRGLLEDYLAGMRVQLGELAGIADRLDAR